MKHDTFGLIIVKSSEDIARALLICACIHVQDAVCSKAALAIAFELSTLHQLQATLRTDMRMHACASHCNPWIWPVESMARTVATFHGIGNCYQTENASTR